MYPVKSLKWDPVSGAFAIRTQLPDTPQFTNMAWLIGTSNVGARSASEAEVSDWVDIPIDMLTALAESAQDEGGQ